ncbi:hypothetical protein [Bacteroides sp. 519]|uniref:hypothetical protein n=1 Tax=Bacteroides sp. 519 TaxID=2302937 RepID=UPI0013D61C8A|nr:hypothetical protein [Bacteroides sp. 519]NDV57021.1 hypothetical protein [Bacteroides sp. 519]
MVIESEPDYFLVCCDLSSQAQTKTLHISKSFPEHIERWNVQTRFSPCFKVTDHILKDGIFCLSDDTLHFIFVGSLSLSRIKNSLLVDTYVWLSYGMYNIIIATPDEHKIAELRTFLEEEGLRYEYWPVSRSIIGKNEFFVPVLASPVKLSQKLLEKYSKDKVMFTAIRGYYTHVNTACERLRHISKQAYERMVLFHDSVENYILGDGGDVNDNEEEKIFNFSYISSINACLTRYNSQLVMGFSPILEQDISVCGHSLFGIGMASLGINNMGDYFYDKVGGQYIGQRFVKLLGKKYGNTQILNSLSSSDAILKRDYLAEIPLSDLDNLEKQRTPLLVYFSSRDGFRNQYNALSVPLIALYGCNTPGWSLKTISHEASHILVNSMLDYLLRNLQDNNWLRELVGLSCIKDLDEDNDTFEKAILQLLSIGLIDIQTFESGVKDHAADDLYHCFSARNDEMREIMAHAFDFLYFYNSDLESYIGEIWSTWAELPYMSISIPDYVMRSLCIIVLNQLEHPRIEDEAINKFREIIAKLNTSKHSVFSNGHLEKVLEYINPSPDNEECLKNLQSKLIRRKFLVQCVRTFFYSHQIGTLLADEKWPISNDKLQSLRSLEVPEIPFSNPLRVTELSASSKSLSEAKSYLLYYNLAFNYARE